ncbi:MAG: ribonuclease E [Opitutus sp.]|jgi:hypothetical protein|nr:ribonuclease E [Opitutus sp.]MCS6248178.1 ribonuclease E [Opitutus sp.]MCS6273444.1 ribonuclease E [Opitutus sp.]MCS6276962.1 ribonuclease E [Opitutus sp.]MCS6299990.1 ribonuclease E [Opitutus sp.]
MKPLKRIRNSLITTLTILIIPSVYAGITFDFNYLPGSGFLDSTYGASRQAQLNIAANRLGSYFSGYTANLTFDIGEENEPGTLASAYSALVSASPGFYNTVVQQKILGGIDANGAAADGHIYWNFASPGSLGNTVGAADYDFVSLAMHELTHTLGFGAGYSLTSGNYSRWIAFLTNKEGVPLIELNEDDRNAVVIGGNSFDENFNFVAGTNGTFFSGANAVAVYGGLVPIYSPNPFEDGSSLAHLDDYTFIGGSLMNAGSGFSQPQDYSILEMAMLKDLGYTNLTAIPEPATSAMMVAWAMAGFSVWRRRNGNRRRG